MDPKYRNLPLNPLRVFAIASRHRTFTSAAKHMGVSQVAISRQISILENYLGVTLFERTARSVKLTEVGHAFGKRIAGLFDGIEQATHEILTNERENTINLRIYPTFAHHWLLPRLGSFVSAHPDYRVRLDTAVEPLDFRGTHLDVALQLGLGPWRDTKSRVLFEEEVDMVCAPAYAASHGGLHTKADIETGTPLHARYRRLEWEVWAAEVGVDVHHLDGMEFESSLLLYTAARQGLGMAVGQLALLETDLKNGDLIRPLGRTVKTGSAFHVIWPTLTSASLQTKHFIDWLLVEAGQAPEFFKKR